MTKLGQESTRWGNALGRGGGRQPTVTPAYEQDPQLAEAQRLFRQQSSTAQIGQAYAASRVLSAQESAQRELAKLQDLKGRGFDVPDDRLDRVAALEGSKKTVHATLEFLDLPAMARPEHGGGLGARFLGRLREMDAVAVVLRAFTDETIVSQEAGTDPVEQAEILDLELTMSDAEVFTLLVPHQSPGQSPHRS